MIIIDANIRVPLKTALKRENEIVAPRARKVSESLLAQGEETSRSLYDTVTSCPKRTRTCATKAATSYTVQVAIFLSNGFLEVP